MVAETGIAEWCYETASKMLALLSDNSDSVSVSLTFLIRASFTNSATPLSVVPTIAKRT
jgi:hypothetical protein